MSTRLTRSFGHRRAATTQGHVIVVGLGSIGLRVVHDLLADGNRVVVVERDPDNPHLGQVRAGGVPIVIGDATAPAVIADVNASGRVVVAIDLPTGVSADSHELEGEAIEASMTVTLAAPKIPLILPPADVYGGDLVIADIGIPYPLFEELEGDYLELLKLRLDRTVDHCCVDGVVRVSLTRNDDPERWGWRLLGLDVPLEYIVGFPVVEATVDYPAEGYAAVLGWVLFPVTGLLLSPMIASAAMTFSSVSVITNALRASMARSAFSPATTGSAFARMLPRFVSISTTACWRA